MARVAGGDPFKRVHIELMEVVVGVLRMDVGSKKDTTNIRYGCVMMERRLFYYMYCIDGDLYFLFIHIYL